MQKKMMGVYNHSFGFRLGDDKESSTSPFTALTVVFVKNGNAELMSL